jgi:hypothetical protein
LKLSPQETSEEINKILAGYSEIPANLSTFEVSKKSPMWFSGRAVSLSAVIYFEIDIFSYGEDSHLVEIYLSDGCRYAFSDFYNKFLKYTGIKSDHKPTPFEPLPFEPTPFGPPPFPEDKLPPIDDLPVSVDLPLIDELSVSVDLPSIVNLSASASVDLPPIDDLSVSVDLPPIDKLSVSASVDLPTSASISYNTNLFMMTQDREMQDQALRAMCVLTSKSGFTFDPEMWKLATWVCLVIGSEDYYIDMKIIAMCTIKNILALFSAYDVDIANRSDYASIKAFYTSAVSLIDNCMVSPDALLQKAAIYAKATCPTTVI